MNFFLDYRQRLIPWKIINHRTDRIRDLVVLHKRKNKAPASQLLGRAVRGHGAVCANSDDRDNVVFDSLGFLQSSSGSHRHTFPLLPGRLRTQRRLRRETVLHE